ncbi:hypothetical protein [Synechococcus lacustris]|uniref:hypothetical protein n=1 Tax=Synechococcus lacustris TaxID=2116544 RepID=UPI003BF85F0C
MVTTYNALVTAKCYENFFDSLIGDNKTLKKINWQYDSELACFIFQGGSTFLSEINEAKWKSTGLRSFLLTIDMYGQASLSGNLKLAEYAGTNIEHTSGYSVPANALESIKNSPAAAIIKKLDEIADEAEVVDGDSDEVFGKRYVTSASILNPREIPLADKLYELESVFQELGVDYAIACPGNFFDGEYEDAHYEIGPFAYAQVWIGPYAFVYISENEVDINELTPPPAPSPDHQRLAGQALLDKVEELGDDIPKPDLVRACGYVSIKRSGEESLRFTDFYQAVLDAKGLSLGDGEKSSEEGRLISNAFDSISTWPPWISRARPLTKVNGPLLLASSDC